MAGRRRKATDDPDQQHLSRRMKQSEADSSCPIQYQMFTREALSSPKSYLDKMPSEILQQMFLYSREPCLIHTCSRLHQILPSFTHWTRRLAGMALIDMPGLGGGLGSALSDKVFDTCAAAAIANRVYSLPLAGLHAPLVENVRHEFQKEVFQSRWFTLEHLEQTYLEIFSKFIYDGLLESGTFRLSRYQLKRLRNMVARFKTIWTKPKLTLHIKTSTGICRFEMGVNSLKFSNRVRILYKCRAIRFTYIPDCVLQEPDPLRRREVLRLAMISINHGPTDMQLAGGLTESPPECSTTALRDAIRYSIDASHEAYDGKEIPHRPFQHYYGFRRLLALHRDLILVQKRPSLIDIEMLRASTRSWGVQFFEELLEQVKHCWDDEHIWYDCVKVVTAEQLVALGAALPKTEKNKLIMDAIEATLGKWRQRQRDRGESEPPQLERGTAEEVRQRLLTWGPPRLRSYWESSDEMRPFLDAVGGS